MSIWSRSRAGKGTPVLEDAAWICVGSRSWRMPPWLQGVVAGLLVVLGKATLGRVSVHRWARYVIHPAEVPPLRSPAPELTPVTDEIIGQLRRHPDHDQNQLRSGLRWWDQGLRRAYIWIEAEGPLCVQWLVTREDTAKLKSLGEWASMYPPLPEGRGQVENLFAFRNTRRPGVGVLFLHGTYQVQRRAGLREVITHIAEENTAARSLSERTGWLRYGTVTRFQVGLPGLRGLIVCLHGVGVRS